VANCWGDGARDGARVRAKVVDYGSGFQIGTQAAGSLWRRRERERDFSHELTLTAAGTEMGTWQSTEYILRVSG